MKNFIKTSLIIPKLCPFSLVRWFFVSFSLLQSEGQPGQLDLNQSWLGFLSMAWESQPRGLLCWTWRAKRAVVWGSPRTGLWLHINRSDDVYIKGHQQEGLSRVLVSPFVLWLHQAEVYFSVFLYFISLWFSFDIFLIDPVHFVLLGRKINRFLS